MDQIQTLPYSNTHIESRVYQFWVFLRFQIFDSYILNENVIRNWKMNNCVTVDKSRME